MKKVIALALTVLTLLLSAALVGCNDNITDPHELLVEHFTALALGDRDTFERTLDPATLAAMSEDVINAKLAEGQPDCDPLITVSRYESVQVVREEEEIRNYYDERGFQPLDLPTQISVGEATLVTTKTVNGERVSSTQSMTAIFTLIGGKWHLLDFGSDGR